jgi:hypothetical protein
MTPDYLKLITFNIFNKAIEVNVGQHIVTLHGLNELKDNYWNGQEYWLY